MATEDNRPAFLIYHEDVRALADLSDAQYGRLIRAIAAYSEFEIEPCKDDPLINLAFSMIRGKIERDKQRYQRQLEQRRAAGRASAAKRASTTVDESQRAEENESETETKIESKAETNSSLSRPSLSDIAAEVKRAGLQVDAAQFLADCEADGWRDGRGEPIRDWKKWLRGYAVLKHAGAKVPPPASDYEQRGYSEDELSHITDTDFDRAVDGLTEGGGEG